MRKLALLVTVVLFVSSAPGAYAAGRDGIDDSGASGKSSAGISKAAIVGSYLKEVYVSTPPAAGVNYNAAEKIFRVGDDIDFVTRYYLSPVDTFSIIFLVTDASGQVWALPAETVTPDQSGNRFHAITSRCCAGSTGTFNVNTLMLFNSGAILLSPSGYTFIVE